jgi:hypothetical protein
MPQPRKFVTDCAQPFLPQLRLDFTQAIGTPHGTPAVCNFKKKLPIFILLQLLAKAVAQAAGQRKIPPGRHCIHLNIPLLTAAVGTGPRNAMELIIIAWLYQFHKSHSHAP